MIGMRRRLSQPAAALHLPVITSSETADIHDILSLLFCLRLIPHAIINDVAAVWGKQVWLSIFDRRPWQDSHLPHNLALPSFTPQALSGCSMTTHSHLMKHTVGADESVQNTMHVHGRDPKEIDCRWLSHMKSMHLCIYVHCLR